MATPIPANRAAWSAWSVAAATGGEIARTRGDGARGVGIVSDSRAAVPGVAFVALVGEAHDGHAHAGTAIARGARLVVLQRGRPLPEGDADVVVVDDTLRAWGDLAAAHVRAWRRARASLAHGQVAQVAHADHAACVVAITGSAGKTTTKDLCAALLATVGPCRATPGNLNNRVGVPAVAFGLTPDDRFAVLEMGMSVAGEIAALGAIAPPDVAILLNVGVAHAEGVGGSRADVAREKGAIYESLGPAGVAVVNVDDAAASAQVARSRAGHEATFGRAEGARYRLVERTTRPSAGALGSRVVLSRAGEILAVHLPLVGDAAAIDLLAALAAAEAASGVTFSAARIDEALAAVAPPEGRAAVVTLADGTLLLDDSYNANPASMRAALATLRELAGGGEPASRRAVAVLGEMKELGPAAVAEHEALGDAVAAAGVGLLIGCGGLADATLARAAAAGVAIVRAADAHDAARFACELVAAGDVVLVKGSRGVQTESVVNALVKARGRGSIREALRAPGHPAREGESA